ANQLYEEGNDFYRNKDYQAAVNSFTEAIALNPTDDRFYNVRGSAFMQLDNYANALADYNEAIRLNPTVAKYFYNRANANYKL
ncbi:tetratricopeptide repeat protein, partial [Pseudomonas fluorescens]